jgi:hypothetical protein
MKTTSGALACAAVLAGLAAPSCGGSSSEPHGSPVLLKVYWTAGNTRSTVWSRDPDPSLVATAPALATELDLVFDRRLDGDRIEDTVTVNGVQTTQPKANPPVTMTWPDFAQVMSDPPFAMQVYYNSAPFFGGTTSYVFARPTTPGFPSATTVSLQLDKNGLTSAYGEPMDGPDQIDVPTAPFTASFGLPAAGDAGVAVDPTFQLPLVFTGRPAAAASVAPFVHASAGGIDLPFDLLTDARVPGTLFVAPTAACGGGWPAGATIDVSLDAGLPDAFGVGLASGASTSFAIGGTGDAGVAPDGGGCGQAPDGGPG